MFAMKFFLGVQLLATPATAVTLVAAPAVIPAEFGVLVTPSGFVVA